MNISGPETATSEPEGAGFVMRSDRYGKRMAQEKHTRSMSSKSAGNASLRSKTLKMNEQEHYRKEKRNNSLGTYTVFKQIHSVRGKKK